MVSSLPDLPPPLSFLCIIGILIVYVMCCYLVIDFISQDDDDNNNTSSSDHQDSRMADDQVSYSHLSVEELQEITCLYHKVGEHFSVCAICLENLMQAEVCRVLPACRHEFHAQCIDSWLTKRLNCPVCRAPFRFGRSFCR